MLRGEDDPFRGWGAVDQAVVGEITTRLLLASDALRAEASRSLLARLAPGSRPERAGHPVERVESVDLPFSVDCNLATARARVRSIGVVSAHAVLAGGHVLQGSAYARVVIGNDTGARQRWSYYSSRPGYVEVHSKAAPEDITAGFLTARPDAQLLDLAGIGKHVIDLVHADPSLDRRPRLRTSPLRLRWTARIAEAAGKPSMEFVRFPDGSFQIDAVAAPDQVAGLMRFCEDVALHTWLLSTMTWSFENAAQEGDKLGELGPALEYLGHLWSPGETTDEDLAYLWKAVEARLHLSRGWHSQVTRIRDQISLLTLKALQQRVQTVENSW